MDWDVYVILGAVGMFFLAMALSKDPPKEEKCPFCKEGTVLIAYREDTPGERKVAQYCPICGRKIGGEDEKK